MTAVSSDSTVMTTSVTEYNTVGISAKKKGEVSITIKAVDEVNGYEASKTLVFRVIEAADAVDVVSGIIKPDTSTINKGHTIYVDCYYLKSVAFKIKSAYEDVLMLKRATGVDGDSDVNVTVQDGLYVVTNTRLRTAIPQAFFSLEGINDSPNIAEPQIGGVQVLFIEEDGVEYEIYDTSRIVTTFPASPGGTEDGGTMQLSLSQYQDVNVYGVISIEPRFLVEKQYVVSEVISSDSAVALVMTEEASVWGNQRRIPIKILSAGTATITLRVSDGMSYDATSTITLNVVE